MEAARDKAIEAGDDDGAADGNDDNSDCGSVHNVVPAPPHQALEDTGATGAAKRASQILGLGNTDAGPCGRRQSLAEVVQLGDKRVSAHSEHLCDTNVDLHREELLQRLGLTPEQCLRRVVGCLCVLAVPVGIWSTVYLEYLLFYVRNDVEEVLLMISTAAFPQCAGQIFVYPLFGRMSDRIGRRPFWITIVIALWCYSAIILIPHPAAFWTREMTYIVVGFVWMLIDATLRDCFSLADWEIGGGLTSLRAKVIAITGCASVSGAGFAWSVLRFWRNEYKEDCGRDDPRRRCGLEELSAWEGLVLPPVGGLKLCMMAACGFVLLGLLAVLAWFPETLRPTQSTETGLEHVRARWREAGRPWDNLRCMATPSLKTLLVSLQAIKVVAVASMTCQKGFLIRRHGLSSADITQIGTAGLLGGFLSLNASRLVKRRGDFSVICLPAAALAVLYLLGLTLVPFGGDPTSPNALLYVLLFFAGGPASSLTSLGDGIFQKLVPSDIQATASSANYFVYYGMKPFFMLFFAWLFFISEDMPEPFGALPFLVCTLAPIVSLIVLFVCRQYDPHEALSKGQGLDAFYNSAYAKSDWYTIHGSGNWQAMHIDSPKRHGAEESATSTQAPESPPDSDQMEVSQV